MSQPNVHLDPRDAVIIGALADHMHTILEAFRTFGRATPTWAVAEHSQLSNERTLLASQFGPAGVWGTDTADYVADAALLFLMAQSDHLHILHRAYSTATGLMFGIGPPARSLLEISGYVHWLLHPDLETVRTRASRSLLSQLHDATRQRSVAKDLGAPASYLGQVSEQIRTIKSRVAADFYESEIEYDKSGRLILRKEKHPGPGEALQHLKTDGSQAWNSRGAYSFLSNASHPTLHVITDTMQFNGDRVPTGFGHADTTLHYRVARIAMAGFLTTWQITAAYRGLDQRVSRDLALRIDDLPEP